MASDYSQFLINEKTFYHSFSSEGAEEMTVCVYDSSEDTENECIDVIFNVLIDLTEEQKFCLEEGYYLDAFGGWCDGVPRSSGCSIEDFYEECALMEEYSGCGMPCGHDTCYVPRTEENVCDEVQCSTLPADQRENECYVSCPKDTSYSNEMKRINDYFGEEPCMFGEGDKAVYYTGTSFYSEYIFMEFPTVPNFCTNWYLNPQADFLDGSNQETWTINENTKLDKTYFYVENPTLSFMNGYYWCHNPDLMGFASSKSLMDNFFDDFYEPIIGGCGTVTPGLEDSCCQNLGKDYWDTEDLECKTSEEKWYTKEVFPIGEFSFKMWMLLSVLAIIGGIILMRK